MKDNRLLDAVKLGDSNAVIRLIQEFGWLYPAISQEAWEYAQNYKKWPMVQQLINAGINTRGNIYSKDALVRAGAQFNIQDNFNDPVLKYILNNNDIHSIEELIDDSILDVDTKGINGSSLLEWAAQNGYLSLVKKLIDNGADPDPRDNAGFTPLIWASINGHLSIVQELIKAGADIEGHINNHDLHTPLNIACAQGHYQIVRELMNAGASTELYTPIFFAAIKNGDMEVVTKFLGSQVDINIIYCEGSKNGHGYTPLIAAILNGQNVVALHLISNGADINKDLYVTHFNGSMSIDSPIVLAINYGQSDIAMTLLLKGAMVREQICYDAASKGYTDFVLKFMDTYVVDRNAKTKKLPLDKKKVFNNAVSNDHSELVIKLLERGIQDESPEFFCWAAKNGRFDIVSSLVDQTNLDKILDKDGHKPIDLASMYGDLKTVIKLIELGANIKTRDNMDHTPLEWAAQCGHTEIAVQLIAAGANVRAKDKDGHSPLELAAQNGYLEIVRLLLDAGANVNVIDNEGHTPAEEAYSHGYYDIVDVLIDAGADYALPELL